jgi:HEAT repeat protein
VALESVVPAALLVLTGVLLLLTATTWIRKVAVGAAARRRDRLEAQLRPRLFEVLAEGAGDVSAGVEGRSSRRVLESITVGLLPKLRGADRTQLVAWLEADGAVDRARHQTRSRRPVVRAQAAQHLGDLAVASARPELVALLDDRHHDVRMAAARGLGKLGLPDTVPVLLAHLDGPRRVPAGVAALALLHVGPAGVVGLRDGLLHRASAVRLVSSELLGRFGDLTATPGLARRALDDTSVEVRVAAARALGRIGSPAAGGALVACAGAGQPAPLRAAAAWSLGQLGDPQALATLESALHDPDHAVAHAAATALAEIGPAGLALLDDAAEGLGTAAEHAREAIEARRLARAGRDGDRRVGRVA